MKKNEKKMKKKKSKRWIMITLLQTFQTKHTSTLHRHVPLDLINVKNHDA